MATISAAPTWSANAGSSGAGRTRSPEGSWVTSRLSSSGASIRSSTDTASTIVWWGVSLSITATSPNCRSASTRHTGLSERCARVTASEEASTDLPDPPLVENTVRTWPLTSSSSAAEVAPRPGSARSSLLALWVILGAWSSVTAMRCTVWASASASPASASTSRTPARRACCNSVVESSSTTRMVPSIGYWAMTRPAIARESSLAHEGPRMTTTGTVPVKRAVSSSIVANGVAPSPRSPIMRSRVGAWLSTIATETRTGTVGTWSLPERGSGSGAGSTKLGDAMKSLTDRSLLRSGGTATHPAHPRGPAGRSRRASAPARSRGG